MWDDALPVPGTAPTAQGLVLPSLPPNVTSMVFFVTSLVNSSALASLPGTQCIQATSLY